MWGKSSTREQSSKGIIERQWLCDPWCNLNMLQWSCDHLWKLQIATFWEAHGVCLHMNMGTVSDEAETRCCVNASADAVSMHQWAQEKNHRTASASIGCGELTHEKEEKLLMRSQCFWTLIREKPSMHCVRFRRLEEWTLNSWVRSDVGFCSTSDIEGRHKMCSF